MALQRLPQRSFKDSTPGGGMCVCGGGKPLRTSGSRGYGAAVCVRRKDIFDKRQWSNYHRYRWKDIPGDTVFDGLESL